MEPLPDRKARCYHLHHDDLDGPGRSTLAELARLATPIWRQTVAHTYITLDQVTRFFINRLGYFTHVKISRAGDAKEPC